MITSPQLIPSLAYFVRSLVGMDRQAALEAFASYLNDNTLTAQQNRFVALLVDQMTVHGVVEASALYEPPFSDLDGGGPEAVFAGNEKVVEGLFGKLRMVMDRLRRVE